MRIDSLTAENKISQGKKQREWLKRRSPQHLIEVEKLLTDCVAMTKHGGPPDMVILGAGACTEIPLQKMAQLCRKVTLVDLDTDGLKTAIAEVAAPLRKRIHIARADITGGVSKTLEEILNVVDWRALNDATDNEVAHITAQALDSVPVPAAPRIAGIAPAAIVVSALVLTQLFSLPLQDVLQKVALVRAGMHITIGDNTEYIRAANVFRRKITLAHLHLLQTCMTSNGAAALISDFAGQITRADFTPDTTLPELRILPAAALSIPSDLEKQFYLPEQIRHWQWINKLPEGAAYPGRMYTVIGAILRHSPAQPL